MLEFVAINRNPGGRPTLHSLAPAIDLSNARGRSLCVRYSVNIARVLVSLHEAFPDENVVWLGQEIARGSSIVNIMGDYAIKKILLIATRSSWTGSHDSDGSYNKWFDPGSNASENAS